jgi:Flp pilus assembly protein TadD
MLHNWATAIEHLDKAIQLNPGFANAYCIRGIARKNIGDTRGAAADSERSEQMAC